MERLVRERLHSEDFAVAVTDGTAYGLATLLVLHKLAFVDQRELTEEVAFLHGGFLKKRRVVGHANGHRIINDGAKTLLGKSPGLGLAFQHKGTHDAAIVSSDICRLCGKKNRGIITINGTKVKREAHQVRDVKLHRDVIDGGIHHLNKGVVRGFDFRQWQLDIGLFGCHCGGIEITGFQLFLFGCVLFWWQHLPDDDSDDDAREQQE